MKGTATALIGLGVLCDFGGTCCSTTANSTVARTDSGKAESWIGCPEAGWRSIESAAWFYGRHLCGKCSTGAVDGMGA